MNLKKNFHLVFLIILIMAGGLLGTYFFATWDKLSRELKDFSSMLFLIISLLIAGILIVKVLSKMRPTNSPES